MTIGIYKITCKESGQCYIGQSKTIEARWKKAHYKRFSPDTHDYEVLVACPAESLDFFERAFISGYDSHRNGFNKTIGGGGTWPPCSDETRKKLSETGKGRQSPRMTGKKHSEETKAKISAAQIIRLKKRIMK